MSEEAEERFEYVMKELSRFPTVYPDGFKPDLEKPFLAYGIQLKDFEMLSQALPNPKRLPFDEYRMEIATLARRLFLVKKPFNNPEFAAMAGIGGLASSDAFISSKTWAKLAPEAARALALNPDRYNNNSRAFVLERVQEQVVKGQLTLAQGLEVLQHGAMSNEKLMPQVLNHLLIPLANHFPEQPAIHALLKEAGQRLNEAGTRELGSEFGRLHRTDEVKTTIRGLEPLFSVLATRTDPGTTRALSWFLDQPDLSPEMLQLAHQQIRTVTDPETVYNYSRYFMRTRPAAEVASLIPSMAGHLDDRSADQLFANGIGDRPLEEWLNPKSPGNAQALREAILLVATRARGSAVSGWMIDKLAKGDPRQTEPLLQALARAKDLATGDLHTLCGSVLSALPEPYSHRLAQTIVRQHMGDADSSWRQIIQFSFGRKDSAVYEDLGRVVRGETAERPAAPTDPAVSPDHAPEAVAGGSLGDTALSSGGPTPPLSSGSPVKDCVARTLEAGFPEALRATRAETLKLAGKLQGLPGLNKYMLALVDDPQIDPSIRRLIARSLKNPDITIENFTEELRRQYAAIAPILKDSEAVMIRVKRGIPFIGEDPALAASWAAQDRAYTGTPYRVLAQERPIDGRHNAVAEMVHELSHVKCDETLAAHLERLVGRLPESLIRRVGPHQIAMSQQFYTFIQERYAIQMEYKSAKSGWKRYFQDWWQYRWGNRPPDLTDAQMSHLISDRVILEYNITDPEVLKLRGLSISQILLGKAK